MADVDTGGGGGGKGRKGGGPKTKKKSTRIDMTAMVDVAFLLLTFFVLTATMTNSAVMELTMPPKIDDPEQKEDLKKKIDEEKILTVILDDNDQVKWYWGVTDPEVDSFTYATQQTRDLLLNHINRYSPLCKEVNNAEGCWDPIFVVKPKKQASYENLVDLLDELAITQAPKYAIDEFTETDSLILIGEYEREAPAE